MPYKDKGKAAEYNRKYKAVWYQENKKRLIARVAGRRKEIRAWLTDLKASMKCERCGFDHPAALDFHHKDGEQKENDVAYLCNLGWSKESLLEEIQKCEVLCANCHRILHYEEKWGYGLRG